ncbi:bifunctional glycosyltransferase/CDP-glycerol:glycerophosphate glycerophosphotransferase [Rhizomonospora bruguierae]|uniref:bifunctional glycosyltransferase/CDP-glycerol:glycerophosphate glycerophosphotransferase n=1 Tax=Rhizomonospora bruguierae TaxID=1581705 RepID=UPI001BD17478|nr:bifunctional glycosyltransferase/CDP-glycerol:glycerophosphate glycerophosphotransferase [Micromonospora sp. NBRC 107566]
MTLLSVVVPCYKVQGYLRECLDSILDQRFTDLEVIAIDDRSPDHSGEILAEYAARDPRVRVLTPPENVGLGRARNLGLDAATGEYVWFVDSDDWLTPGAIGAVAQRLRDGRLDALIVDYVRAHWDGRIEPSSSVDVLPAAPDEFALHEWLPAFRILHVAWNKIIRRELLLQLNFRFESGWYEDVSFTYPVLGAARRIGVLNRVCVNYRQRRTGAITRTRGERHFEIFDHWVHAWERTAGCAPEFEALRRPMFDRMIWHLLLVLGNGERVPARSRRAFFARMTEFYRRYRPEAGYTPPGGLAGKRHRMIARGSFVGFEALRQGRANVRRARRFARRGKRAAFTAARRVRERLYRGYYRIQRRLPVDRSLALYASYWYRGYLCNPAAIHAKARELAPGVRGVVVVNRSRAGTIPSGVDHVVAGTLRYYRLLARAGYLFNNVNWPNWVRKRAGSVHVMTHHGTPLKLMGLAQLDHPVGAKGKDIRAELARADRWDFSVTSNAFTTEIWERAYPCRYETLEVGYPRNDRLALATPADSAAAREKVGVPADATVLLYAPTHREWLEDGRPVLDLAEFAAQLPPDHVLLVRSHYFYDKAGRPEAGGRVVDVSRYPIVEDLYLASDALITDYSSAMFDYAVLDRPVVIFAPDWEVYRTNRGVTFDLMAEPPGAVATTLPELVDAFTGGGYAGDAAAKARAAFRARFCALDDGGAAERVVRRVLPTSARHS